MLNKSEPTTDPVERQQGLLSVDPCWHSTGSVVGPVLFNIYLNDLLRTLDPACFLAYADDLTIITSDKSVSKDATAQQELLGRFSVRSKQSGLALNPDKCKCMIIAPPKRTTSNMSPFVLNGHALQFVDKLLLVGVTVSSTLYKLFNSILKDIRLLECLAKNANEFMQ